MEPQGRLLVRSSGALSIGISALMLVASVPVPVPASVPASVSAQAGVGRPLSPLAVLGRQIFLDPSLSASGRLACAGCHSPEHAYGPPNGRAVQLGGPQLDQQGARAVPSLRYVLNRTPIWSDDRTASIAERLREGIEPPTGGFGWDGRFDSLHQQAAFPLLAPNEMANASLAEVVAKARKAPYAAQLRRAVGDEIYADAPRLFEQMLIAIERFELEDPSFRPYTSRYDAYLDGKATLTDAEQRGLALFDDLKRGNCASCHIDRKGADGSHPLFTDYEMEALGVPRNPEIRANLDSHYFDMGLCGPVRTDQAKKTEYCGLFKTPTLRNVSTRRVFFHNGRIHTLKEALRFYVRRDTEPQLWYSRSAAGQVTKFDDLPEPLRANVDHLDEPMTRSEGAAPVWTDAEIDDVIAFLNTLTDGDVVGAAE